MLGLAACGDTKEDAAGDPVANSDSAYKPGLTAIVIPKQLGSSYEKLEYGGTVAAFEELGGEATVLAPTHAGASSQVPLLQSAIQKQPDAIVLAGNGRKAVAPVLKQALAAGVRVVAQDSDVASDAREVFVKPATTQGIGELLVRMTERVTGGRGEVAILSATADATSQNAWIRVFKQELREPQHAGLRLVRVVYGDDDDPTSIRRTQRLLAAYPSLRAIVAPTTVGIAAAARYISTSPKKGRVAVTGLGTPSQMRKFVKNGTVEVFALWSPKDVGYLGGYAAAALASGIITGAEGETFRAGRLGMRTIGPDGEVVLGPPLELTRENIDDYDF